LGAGNRQASGQLAGKASLAVLKSTFPAWNRLHPAFAGVGELVSSFSVRWAKTWV